MAVTERRIVKIDEEKCNGCGLCVTACHEGAIQMVNGKARLMSEAHCDGLGDCLAPCPMGAISIEVRPAEAYDADAVAAKMAARTGGEPSSETTPKPAPATSTSGCPGLMAVALKNQPVQPQVRRHMAPGGKGTAVTGTETRSELMNWPVQLRLIPPSAAYLKGADLLLAADCTAVAVPDFHKKFLKDKPVMIACPKLDDPGQQVEKLAEVIMAARPASLTVVIMEVPCCAGLTRVAREAVVRSGLSVPLRAVVVGTNGEVKTDSVIN